ncbi:MAG TPA: alanine--glyoxylate aminotransferase family protein [Gemmatimonadaceae bacterium]|nr:alanine--glyoxylate aminotransferase family protein [Gemmatimonadaceae bacterium]
MTAQTSDRVSAGPASPTAPRGFGRFFLPGPTEVRPSVLAAMQQPMIGHRGKGMEDLIARIEPDLQYVFRTSRPVYIASSSATGLMEGAIRNGVRSRVLSLVNGAFSERFFQIAQACGVEAEALTVPMGQAHTPQMLTDALKGGRFDAVTVVHSETSTGALNPIGELAKVAHEAGDVALLVDSVSGMAGAPVETDAWELDFVLTGSQKAFAIPAGLAFGVARDNVIERAKNKRDRGIYFDLIEYDKAIRKNQTPNTPALSLFYALAEQLKDIRAETIEARWARHAAMAKRTWAWVDEVRDGGLPISVLAPEGSRSPTVTCVALPSTHNGGAVTAAMKARGFVISAGYGSLKDTSVRIGHMGDHTIDELNAVLDTLREVLTA